MIAQNQEIYLIIFSSLFGLCFGSFITMASYRIPRGEDIVYKASHCPNCNNQLTFFDLFPVFSWLMNFGKCRYCKEKVSFRYPAIEIVTAIIFCLSYKVFGFTVTTLVFWLSAMFLILIAVIEIEKRVTPIKVLLPLLVLAVLFAFLEKENFQNLLIYNFLLGVTYLILGKIKLSKIDNSIKFKSLFVFILPLFVKEYFYIYFLLTILALVLINTLLNFKKYINSSLILILFTFVLIL